jgi:hypothetical protein
MFVTLAFAFGLSVTAVLALQNRGPQSTLAWVLTFGLVGSLFEESGDATHLGTHPGCDYDRLSVAMMSSP